MEVFDKGLICPHPFKGRGLSGPYDTKPDWATKVETPWSIPHFEKMLLDLLLLLFFYRYPLRFFLHDNAMQCKVCVAIYYHFCSVLVSVPIYLDTDWGIVGPQSHIDIKGETRSQQECTVTFSQLCASIYFILSDLWFSDLPFCFLSWVSLQWNVGRSPLESNIFVQDK